MNKQEIVNKLSTRTNFKNVVVPLCFSECLEIEQVNSFPDILIYHQNDGFDTSWTRINPMKDKFEVDGEIMSGTNNFFKYYKKITKFIKTGKSITSVFSVIPCLIGDDINSHWSGGSDDDDNFEISYNSHSYSGFAHEKFRNGESIRGLYFIEGESIKYDKWIIESREFKLSRILGIDLRKERLEKEKIELHKKLEEIKKQKEEKEKSNYTVVTYISGNYCTLA